MVPPPSSGRRTSPSPGLICADHWNSFCLRVYFSIEKQLYYRRTNAAVIKITGMSLNGNTALDNAHIEISTVTKAAPKIRFDGGPRFHPGKRRLRTRSRVLRSLPFGIAAAALIVLAHLTPFAQQIEDRYGLGLLFSLRRPVPPPEGALIVSIDRQSIDWLRRVSAEQTDATPQLVSCLPAGALTELGRLKGPSSLPRPVYACLLRELDRMGFPVIVFDILFSAPGIPEDDQMLAQAMRNHGATAILSGFERFAIEKSGAKLFVEQNRQPLPLFKESAAATGSFLVPRPGGFVHGYLRQVKGLRDSATLIDAALSLLGAQRPASSSSEHPKSDFMYLWLYGPAGAIRTVPIRDILSGAVPGEVRQTATNTVVFVGASDPSMAAYEDSFPSLYRNEFDANISGVELAATAFLNLRKGHHLHHLSLPVETAVLFLFALALGLFAMNAGARSVWVIAGLAIAYLITAFSIFGQYRLHLPVILPIFVAVPVFAVIALIVRSRTAMSLIMRLAPAPIARRMLAESSSDRGEVATSDATVAFFDIIGSTTIGEKLADLPFGELMNDFHDAVTREVEDCGGFVIAFTGDGVTALFESSVAGSDHALLACRASISSVRKIRTLNLENAKRGIPPLGVRIGMNSGLVAEGSIGAQDRFNFAVVGDAVNVAARLEQLGKTLFPDEQEVILVAVATRERIQGQGLSFVDCGLQQIPGRRSGENVFRLLVH